MSIINKTPSQNITEKYSNSVFKDTIAISIQGNNSIESEKPIKIEEFIPKQPYYINSQTFNWLFMAMATEFGAKADKMAQGAAVMMNRVGDPKYYRNIHGSTLVKQIKAPSQLSVITDFKLTAKDAISKDATITKIAKVKGISLPQAEKLYTDFKNILENKYLQPVKIVGNKGGWRASGDGVNNIFGPEVISGGYNRQPSSIIVVADDVLANSTTAQASKSSVSNVFRAVKSAMAHQSDTKPVDPVLKAKAEALATQLEPILQQPAFRNMQHNIPEFLTRLKSNYVNLDETTRQRTDQLIAKMTAETGRPDVKPVIVDTLLREAIWMMRSKEV